MGTAMRVTDTGSASIDQTALDLDAKTAAVAERACQDTR
jgi:hypothetical protein